MEKKNRIVSIAGHHVGDIAFYLTKILAVGDEPVLIVDLSEQHEIYNTVGRAPEERVGYLRNITIVADAAYLAETFNAFSAIVVYHGFEANDGWWKVSDVQFVISGYDKFDVTDLANGLASVDLTRVHMMFKERFTKKIKDVDIMSMLGIDSSKAGELLEIPFDEASEAIRLAWEYNGNQRVADLPKTDIDVLMEMYDVIEPDVDPKVKKKLITAAR